MLISIDPAKSAGIVVWDGKVPVQVSTLEPLTKVKDKKYYELMSGKSATNVKWVLRSWKRGREQVERELVGYRTQGDAFACLITDDLRPDREPPTVVMEEGFGASTTTIKQHAFLRGYIARICDAAGCPWYEVNVSEWRKVVGPKHDIVFPNNSELAKARAAEIAQLVLPGIEFYSNDETDAMMVGLWALYTGTAK